MSGPIAPTEKDLLVATLSAQRDHALRSLDGLSDDDLRRPVLPSGWSCLGLIRHLTYDEEVFWFGCIVAGDRAAIDEITLLSRGPQSTWQVLAEQSVEEVFAGYREAIRRSDAIIAAAALDDAPAWWPGELFGDWRLGTLREIMLHMITEVACHAGHLDAARELIDGNQWLVLTG